MAASDTPTTTQELVAYYANLLILQYRQQPRAFATIETQVTPIVMPQTTTEEISFSGVSASGSFVLGYDDESASSLLWSATAANVQTALRALTGLGSITVSGSIASGVLEVTFVGVMGVAGLLIVDSNTLKTSGGLAVSIDVTETDLTLPLAVQDAFNLTGNNPAVGVQLDVLGKYVGVTRSGYGIDGSQIVLGDSDFLTLIRFATLTNSAGSSLAEIQSVLNQFFPDEVLVFDYQNMHMSYLINLTIGSQDLIQLVITENLLPKPMGVQLATTIYVPTIGDFFGMVSYAVPTNVLSNPLNTYEDYQTDWPWLDYNDGIQSLVKIETEDGNILTQENGDFLYYG